jgi:TrmH family RNA methyltransferase
LKTISSRDNPFFKTLRRIVEHAAARRDAGVAILEGVHLCDAYLATSARARAIVVGQRALDIAEVVDLLDRADGDQRWLLDDALFASLSQLAQGVPLLMLVDEPRPDRPAVIDRTSVLLDRVQDPGNVGSILRSAAAAGIGDVYLSRGCAAAWSTKVLRAAMGAHFHLRLFEDSDLLALQRAANVPLLATSSHADRSLHAFDLSGDVAWVFGHEGQGVDPALGSVAQMLSIPQPGAGESLNVAAAAAVCFFEQVRQRGR